MPCHNLVLPGVQVKKLQCEVPLETNSRNYNGNAEPSRHAVAAAACRSDDPAWRPSRRACGRRTGCLSHVSACQLGQAICAAWYWPPWVIFPSTLLAG